MLVKYFNPGEDTWVVYVKRVFLESLIQLCAFPHTDTADFSLFPLSAKFYPNGELLLGSPFAL